MQPVAKVTYWLLLINLIINLLLVNCKRYYVYNRVALVAIANAYKHIKPQTEAPIYKQL